MKPPLFVASLILAVAPLVMVIMLITMSQKNQALQTTLQSQQAEINKGSMSQQIGVNLLKEIAQDSVKDTALKDVLSKSGYTVTVSPAASPSPSPSNP